MKNTNLITKINISLFEKYRADLTALYFSNVRTCTLTDHFSMQDAKEKMDQLSEYLQKDSAIVFGCIKDNKLIAFIWAYPFVFREESRIYISVLQVLPQHKRSGIGSKLIDEVINAGINLGIKAIYIHADAQNTGALELYRKNGFVDERIQLCKSL